MGITSAHHDSHAHEELPFLVYLSSLGILGIVACSFMLASVLWTSTLLFFLAGLVFLATGLLTAFAFKALGVHERDSFFAAISIGVVVAIVAGFVHLQVNTAVESWHSIQPAPLVTGDATLAVVSIFTTPANYPTFAVVLLLTFCLPSFLLLRDAYRIVPVDHAP